MPGCAAFGCHYITGQKQNEKYKKPEGVVFHRFPQDRKLWDIWVSKIPSVLISSDILKSKSNANHTQANNNPLQYH